MGMRMGMGLEKTEGGTEAGMEMARRCAARAVRVAAGQLQQKIVAMCWQAAQGRCLGVVAVYGRGWLAGCGSGSVGGACGVDVGRSGCRLTTDEAQQPSASEWKDRGRSAKSRPRINESSQASERVQLESEVEDRRK
jgi:hypothetical protein